MRIFDSIRKIVTKNNINKKHGLISKDDKVILFDKIRQSDLFRYLPHENLEEMFSRMETLEVFNGDTIIREGDEGDYYYLIVKGSAEVTRINDSGKPETIAQLTEPVGLGEEALISKAKRNATVIMTSNGIVMRLSKDAFDDYVKDPMLIWFAPLEAQKKIAEGAQWIDVRDPEISKYTHMHGAITISMKDLRSRTSELNKETLYICYCQNGRHSSTAAFLLRQEGYNVSVLRGGLQSLKRAGLT